MMNQGKVYTPEQISDAERMCLFLDGIKGNGRREYVSAVAMAYISGVECGIAIGLDAQKGKEPVAV